MIKIPHAVLLAACTLNAVNALSAPTGVPVKDTPGDYTHAIPLTISAKQSVLQLVLPQAVYQHARSDKLDDVRLFDADGNSVPHTLLAPVARAETSRKDLPVKIFHVQSAGSSRDDALEVRRSADGNVLSVTSRTNAGSTSTLSSLVLELGDTGPVDALRLQLPAGTSNYQARVALEISDDLKQWETIGDSDVSWLVNQHTDALASDRIEFAPRRFRYARLTWHEGTPLQFARIVAEMPLHSETPGTLYQLTLAPQPGKFAQDLVYAAAPAIPVQRIGLAFSQNNVVMPAQLGHYIELPDPGGGMKTTWRFAPLVQATFYRLQQNGAVRASGDVAITPKHVSEWVLRSEASATVLPQLHLVWTPSTLVFLASGRAPYTLAFGKPSAKSARSSLEQVAPGYSAAEVGALEHAKPGALVQTTKVADVSANEAEQASAAARTRVMALWGALLAGVALLGFMAWKLIKQMK